MCPPSCLTLRRSAPSRTGKHNAFLRWLPVREQFGAPRDSVLRLLGQLRLGPCRLDCLLRDPPPSSVRRQLRSATLPVHSLLRAEGERQRSSDRVQRSLDFVRLLGGSRVPSSSGVRPTCCS